jgi:uncharacterized membrane protein
VTARAAELTTSPSADDSPGLAERVRRVEIVISVLLRIGVVASLAVVVVGTGLTFWRHPSYVSSHAPLHGLTTGSARFPHTPTAVIRGLRAGDGPAVVMTGLLLLIATPVMRVAVSIFAFVYQRDRTFVIITSVVLTLLLVSFALGRAGS